MLAALLFGGALFQSSVPARAITVNEVKAQTEVYVFGEGRGSTEEEADRLALDDLLSKISTFVVSKTSMKNKESVAGKVVTSNSEFESMVSTYRSGQLYNTEKEVSGEEPDVRVVRWMKRADVQKIFDARKTRIRNLIDEGLEAESKGQIDIALRNLYWALLLTKTLQFPGELRYAVADGSQKTVETWLPQLMKEIMGEVKVSTVARNEDEVELLFTYKNRKIESIDYYYNFGQHWTTSRSNATGGAGTMEVDADYNPEQFRIRIAYDYPDRARDIADVDLAYQAVIRKPGVTGREKTFSAVPVDRANVEGAMRRQLQREAGLSGSAAPGSQPGGAPKVVESFSTIDPAIYAKPEQVTGDGEMRAMINRVIKAIESKQYDAVRECFTPSGWDVYEKLVKYGRASMVGGNNFRMYRDGSRTMVRGAQMAFRFENGARKSFTEEVIFSINSEGKIENVSFGLGRTAEDDILGNSAWSEKIRMAVLNFMENYKTAYSLKRLDYIESIFADDAVIITGSVLRKSGRKVNRGDYSGLAFPEDEVRYSRYNKREYINQLKQNFASKSFINVQFAANKVYKLRDEGLYAIQIVQDYFSSNYSDHGYLLLFVDMRDEDNPLITFRSWSPVENNPYFDPANWN